MQFKSLFSICLLGQAAFAIAQTTTGPDSASGSKTLPPSPTGSGVCEPHGDHWHCHAASATSSGPVDTVTATAKTCTPHNDHWHCPSGVSKPATPPAQTQSGAKPTSTEDHDHDHHGTEKECTPHGDHWHCPSGVSAPTFAPTAAPTTSGAAKLSSSAAAAATTATSKALAGGRPVASLGSVGVAVAASLAGAFLFGTLLM